VGENTCRLKDEKQVFFNPAMKLLGKTNLQAERQKAIVFESSCEVRIFGKNKLAG
jgi:hypothetical protein